MADIKEILVHWEAGSTISGLAAALGYSRPTVRKYVRRAARAGLVRGSKPQDEVRWERLARAVVAQAGTLQQLGTACQFTAKVRQGFTAKVHRESA